METLDHSVAYNEVLVKLQMGGVSNDDMLKIEKYLKEKHEHFDVLSEAERVKLFCHHNLPHGPYLHSAQSSNCVFAILVPVHNEDFRRIARQIESVDRQVDMLKDEWEIIYVVNNDLPTVYGDHAIEILERNNDVISSIAALDRSNIHVIDRSSPGNEIANCNIGKVRNLAIAEAASRFTSRDTNGILIHLDADSYFEDTTYFVKLKALLLQEKNLVAIAGGLIFEFSPDAAESSRVGELRQKNEILVLLNRWNALQGFFLGSEEYRNAFKSFFWGAHMITRSTESAAVGGLIPENAMEDGIFGMEMEVYARERGKKVGEAKDTLLAITALRESQRTNSSFGRAYYEIEPSKAIWVDDPKATLKYLQFLEKIYPELEKKEADIAKFDALFQSEEMLLDMCEKEALESILGNADEATRRGAFEKWLSETLSRVFPKVELNRESYLQFEKIIETLPKGYDLIEYLDQMTSKVFLLR